MEKYDLLEQKLNEEAKKILTQIKNDYYEKMSAQKKECLDNLIQTEKVVIVDRDLRDSDKHTLAHGGRGRKDGKIHYYPNSRNFHTYEAMVEKCQGILPHEIFHYFIQPDNMNFDTRIESEMANFYTEGLVEKEARKFCENHPEFLFIKARYGYNIVFVNDIQRLLGADSYEVIFSENDYLKNIGEYIDAYENIMHERNKSELMIKKLVKSYPHEMQRKFFDGAIKMAWEDGNADETIENLLKLNTTIINQKILEVIKSRKIIDDDKEI